MSPSLRHVAPLFLVSWVASFPYAHASECPGGSLDASECVRQLKNAERDLNHAYAEQEEKLKKQFDIDGYGQTEGREYLKQTIEAFRKSNAAWLKYRDADCWFQALNDGMSINYANVVATACKVELTKQRVKSMK